MARNSELEALIAKSPDDPSNYLVYADWLQGQNDPLGELISVGVKRESADSDSLRDQEKALHDANDATWLGALATQKDGFSYTWRRGFLHEVTLGDDDSADVELGDLYQKLRPLPVAQFLHTLRFGAFQNDDGEPTWDSAVEAMIEYGVPSTLRELVFDRGSYWDISWTYLNTLEPVYQRVPDLEVLDIRLGHMDLGAIDLPNLREFSVYTGGFTSENMQSVLAAKWPKLERLVLRFGGNEDYGATCTLDDVLPLLDGKTIPNVKHLALANSEFADALIPHLAKSPLLRQLTSLDLSLGTMSNSGAEAIVAHADAFAHLEELDLHRNYLGGDALAAVQKVAKKVVVHDQEDPDDDYRYCQIGE
jgi:uncharacterized protein (TIGR02996 family)